MASFIPLAIWLVGAFFCYLILRKRKIKATLLWNIAIVLFGPLVIPFTFLAKPDNSEDDVAEH